MPKCTTFVGRVNADCLDPSTDTNALIKEREGSYKPGSTETLTYTEDSRQQ